MTIVTIPRFARHVRPFISTTTKERIAQGLRTARTFRLITTVIGVEVMLELSTPYVNNTLIRAGIMLLQVALVIWLYVLVTRHIRQFKTYRSRQKVRKEDIIIALLSRATRKEIRRQTRLRGLDQDVQDATVDGNPTVPW